MNDSTILCIEVLPNEVWLTLFSYIHIGDITRAFFRLNNRLNSLVYSLLETVHHYEMNEPYYDHRMIRRTHATHVSIRDGRSFSHHINAKHLVWLSLDRPSQKHLQFLQSTYLPRLKHLHLNGVGTINNDVAQLYYTIFISNRVNALSLISCSLPSISAFNWNYFKQQGSAINNTLRSLTLIDDYHLQSYKLFRSVPSLTHLTIKRAAAQNESFIDITRQFGIRRKHVLIHPEDGKMKKVKCWLISKMFIDWLPCLRRLKFEFELDPDMWMFRSERIKSVWILQDQHYMCTLLHPSLKHFEIAPNEKSKASGLIRQELSKRSSASSSNITATDPKGVATNPLIMIDKSKTITSNYLLTRCFDQEPLIPMPASNTTVERLLSSSKNAVTDRRTNEGKAIQSKEQLKRKISTINDEQNSDSDYSSNDIDNLTDNSIESGEP
ncbi:unnamed protein product [Rotaria magnacalcarata]|uniref:F-box domain-containing protein n=1 Tax=Rotaria magnacalcarata TaxID=392030 RepID=A0A816YA33_9BILA|nr:unnamed protein product [Rotaria magnacalcarata]